MEQLSEINLFFERNQTIQSFSSFGSIEKVVMSSEFLYVSIASTFGFAMLILMLIFIYYMIFYNQPVYKQTYQKVKTSDEEDRVEKVKDSKHE
jgi:hypothetical protein